MVDRIELHAKKRDPLRWHEFALFPVNPKAQQAEVLEHQVPVCRQLPARLCEYEPVVEVVENAHTLFSQGDTAGFLRRMMCLIASVCFCAAENCWAQLSTASPKRPVCDTGAFRNCTFSCSFMSVRHSQRWRSWTTSVFFLNNNAYCHTIEKAVSPITGFNTNTGNKTDMKHKTTHKTKM